VGEVQQYQRRAAAFAAELAAAQTAADNERGRLAAAQTALANARAAQGIINGLAAAVCQRAHKRIAGIVARCLAAVYGPDAYGFAIRFERRAGKTAARLVFTRGGRDYGYEEVGGGVVDVAAFALRLAAILLMRPAPRRLLVADEPFRHVAQRRLPAIKTMLETLAREMGVQFIIVTHSEHLRAGTVVEILPE
jgi:DNA repair exonuclease SbcCD ATPase subunit